MNTVAYTDDINEDVPTVCVACCRGYDTDGMYEVTQDDANEYGSECAACHKDLFV